MCACDGQVFFFYSSFVAADLVTIQKYLLLLLSQSKKCISLKKITRTHSDDEQTKANQKNKAE